MNKFSEILKALASAPPGSHAQIDENICARLSSMADSGSFSSAEMKNILDDCAFGALASDFAMMAMHMVWQQMIDAEPKQ